MRAPAETARADQGGTSRTTLDQVGGYGAGVQVHIEDLAAHIAGRERSDMQARWKELLPAYEALASEALASDVS